jgi:hypothetical protein
VSDIATDLVAEADLVDPGIPVALKGESWTISLMRYSIVRILEGDYPGDQLFVGHDDPDLSSPAFQAGVRHRLWLTRTFPDQAMILSATSEREHGAFFCLRFELIPRA